MNDTAQREQELEEAGYDQICEAGFDIEAVQAYRNNCGLSYTPLYSANPDGTIHEAWQDWIGEFEESYQGEMSTEDFASQFADECMGFNSYPDWVQTYFDYEKFERDLFMGDYWESNGYIFRSI